MLKASHELLQSLLDHCINLKGVGVRFEAYELKTGDFESYSENELREYLDIIVFEKDLIIKTIEPGRELYEVGRLATTFKSLQGGFKRYYKQQRKGHWWKIIKAVAPLMFAFTAFCLSLKSCTDTHLDDTLKKENDSLKIELRRVKDSITNTK